jgi:hypothetical protein
MWFEKMVLYKLDFVVMALSLTIIDYWQSIEKFSCFVTPNVRYVTSLALLMV